MNPIRRTCVGVAAVSSLALVSCGDSKSEPSPSCRGDDCSEAGAPGHDGATGGAGSDAGGGSSGSAGETAEAGAGQAGAGGHGGGAVAAPPELEISFPTAESRTHEDTLIVRGRAHADTGVQSVSVNGVMALTANGFATWTALVPLDSGRNELVASSTGQQGQTLGSGATVFVTKTGWALRSSIVATTDAVNNELLLSDADAVAAVDLETGQARLVSGPGRGSGPEFSFSDAIAADAANNRVLVVRGTGSCRSTSRAATVRSCRDFPTPRRPILAFAVASPSLRGQRGARGFAPR